MSQVFNSRAWIKAFDIKVAAFFRLLVVVSVPHTSKLPLWLWQSLANIKLISLFALFLFDFNIAPTESIDSLLSTFWPILVIILVLTHVADKSKVTVLMLLLDEATNITISEKQIM